MEKENAQGTLFEVESTTEPRKNEQKNKRTVLNCDIRTMTKKEFIAFCRKEYNRVHNIEEAPALPKTTKQLQEEFFTKARTVAEDSTRRNNNHLSNFLYAQEVKRLYARIQATAIKITTNKPEKEITNKEKDNAIPTMKKLHDTILAFLLENQEENNNWIQEKENYDINDCICAKTIKPYIKKHYESNNKVIPEEYTLRSIIALLKMILPEKNVTTPKNKRQYKKYYSKKMINTLIENIIVIPR